MFIMILNLLNGWMVKHTRTGSNKLPKPGLHGRTVHRPDQSMRHTVHLSDLLNQSICGEILCSTVRILSSVGPSGRPFL